MVYSILDVIYEILNVWETFLQYIINIYIPILIYDTHIIQLNTPLRVNENI